MGKCFSALKGTGSKSRAGKRNSTSNGTHMGPEGVESSIFLGKDEPLFPKRNPAQRDTGASGNTQASVEMAPLHELNSNGQPEIPKQTMRRSFPPVGLSLLIDQPMAEVFADPQLMAQIKTDIVHTISQIFTTTKDRIRIVEFKPSEPPATVTVNLNIVADRADADDRSPMQLAAEIVTQSMQPNSRLCQAPAFRGLRSGSICEDPFPSSKTDCWAGGVATLRPDGSVAEKPKKKKVKDKAGDGVSRAGGGGAAGAAGGTPANASNAHTLAASSTEPTPRPPADISPRLASTFASRRGSDFAPSTTLSEAPALSVQEMEVTNTASLPGGAIAKDGGQYEGELLHGQREGRGKQHYPNGDVFTGMFLRDKRQGIGRLDLANNGGFYLGEWNDDCRSGKGSLTYGNKDMYVGAWARDMREGEGKMLWSTGAWYQGQFHKNEMHGKGTKQETNDDKYEGEFFEGRRHGRGTSTSAGGVPRTGFWCMDEELVGKSDAEAQLIIRESVYKSNPNKGRVESAPMSDELAAKLQHRNERNSALAQEQQAVDDAAHAKTRQKQHINQQQQQQQQQMSSTYASSTNTSKSAAAGATAADMYASSTNTNKSNKSPNLTPTASTPGRSSAPSAASATPQITARGSVSSVAPPAPPSPAMHEGGGPPNNAVSNSKSDDRPPSVIFNLQVADDSSAEVSPEKKPESLKATPKASPDTAQRPPTVPSDEEARRRMPNPPANPGAPPSASAGTAASAPSAAAPSKSSALSKTSINEAKPPTRPQRSGASTSTTDTLSQVADKLSQWQNAGAPLEYSSGHSTPSATKRD